MEMLDNGFPADGRSWRDRARDQDSAFFARPGTLCREYYNSFAPQGLAQHAGSGWTSDSAE